MHRITRYVGSLVFALALVPTFASAITSDEVQLQIADLMARIAALNSTLNQIPGNTGGTSGTAQTGNAGVNILDGSTTITLTRDIQTGSKGDDVSRLQAHLARDPRIYPEGLVTGLYKGLTTVAIQRFQVACGIVSAGGEQSTGYGRVGPLTRRALAQGCQNANVPSQVGAYLRVTPIEGAAPLTVTADTTINTPKSCEAGTYALSFGDGTPSTLLILPKDRCAEVVQSVKHTYANPGTYNAVLSIGAKNTTVKVTVSGGTTTNTTNTTTTTTNTTGTVTTTGNGYNTATSNAALQVRLVNPTATVARGANMIVSWDGINVPQGSVVRVELRRADNAPLGTVANGLAASGQYVWQVPLAPTGNVSCDATNGQICSTSVVDGSYRFRVYLFTPPTACWGFCQAGAIVPTVYAIANSDSFTIGASATTQTNTAITADAFTATTTSGTAPVAVTFDTAINGSGSCNGGVYSIDFGDGTADADLPYPADACRGVRYSVSHIYTTAGTFTAKLFNIASSIVTSTTAAIKSVVITTTAPAQTNQGPFTVTLGVGGVPNNVSTVFQVLKYACGSYSVNWGDGSTVTTRDAGTAACTDPSATITLTHAYAQTGTHTIKLKRGQGALSGLTTEETATVTVVSTLGSCGAVSCGTTNTVEGNSGP